MTWQGKRRKQLPSNWGAIRKAVLVRDGYRCTAVVYDQAEHRRVPIRCTARASEVHHAVHRDDHRLASLRSVCAYHHNLEATA